jgi:RNA polymerase sigma factor (sigma-70 family)
VNEKENEKDLLAQKFEENRAHLRAVAYRMLGSSMEADDAVQEAWLRLSRSDSSTIENLGGWLTTVVARVCLDMLRSRTARREEELKEHIGAPPSVRPPSDPEREALLADSVGLALLVVLDRLAPAERLAFVLHDMFAVPFEEIAPIVKRTPDATRQLASRARRRVQGAPSAPGSSLSQQRTLIEAFLTALRAGDVEGLVAVLDPDVVVRADAAAAALGAREVRGAEASARQAINYRQGARFIQPMLIDGVPGAVLAPRGKLLRAFTFTLKDGKIVEIEIIAEPSRLQAFTLSLATGQDI